MTAKLDSLPVLGIAAWFGMETPFPERLRLMREAGFDATCIWWEEDRPEIRRLRDRAPGMIRDAGLYLDNIHVPYRGCNALWSADPAEREPVVERHVRWVEDCAGHGVPRMVMHVCVGTRYAFDVPAGIESFRRIAAKGEEAGVGIALENTRSPHLLDRIFGEIDSPALGLCYDNSHDQLYSPQPGKLLADWGRRLAATHVSDTDGKRDRHWLPGDGVIDFGALGDALRSSAEAALMLEVVSPLGEAAESFLARARLSGERVSRSGKHDSGLVGA